MPETVVFISMDVFFLGCERGEGVPDPRLPLLFVSVAYPTTPCSSDHFMPFAGCAYTLTN